MTNPGRLPHEGRAQKMDSEEGRPKLHNSGSVIYGRYLSKTVVEDVVPVAHQ